MQMQYLADGRHNQQAVRAVDHRGYQGLNSAGVAALAMTRQSSK